MTTKLLPLVVVPPGVVTEIGPVVAPAGKVAVIFVAELTTKVVAFVPLKATTVAPVRLAPLIVTRVPTGPLFGEKLELEGAAVKTPALVAVPPGVVTVIVPVVAPEGTTAEICKAEFTVNDAAFLPLNFTEDA